jgi:hypothetical protein
MKQAVQNENLEFRLRGVAEGTGIRDRDVERDSEITGEFVLHFLDCRKRQDVCWLVFSTKTAIQFAHLATGSEQDTYVTKFKRTAGGRKEPLQWAFGYAFDLFP